MRNFKEEFKIEYDLFEEEMILFSEFCITTSRKYLFNNSVKKTWQNLSEITLKKLKEINNGTEIT